MTQSNGTIPERPQRSERGQRVQQAVEQLLRRVLEPTFTGQGSVELDVHRGSINVVRVQTKEQV